MNEGTIGVREPAVQPIHQLRDDGLLLQAATAVRLTVFTGPHSDLHCDREMFMVLDRRQVLPFPVRLFLLFLETNPIPTP